MAAEPSELFPLPWEQVYWSSAPAWPLSVLRPATQYALTDFRLVVRRRGRTVQELALDEVGSVRLSQSWSQRLIGTSTVHVHSRRNGRAPVRARSAGHSHPAAALGTRAAAALGAPIELANIHQGPQLALILQLRAIDSVEDAEFIRSALGGDASLLRPRHLSAGLLAAVTLAFALTFGVIGLARHDSLPPIVYAADDPIAPNGERRSRAEIVAFMEEQVMPFARRVLGPLEGGADNVTCETCHGPDAEARNWQMPGVRALPEPEFRLAGMERAGFWLDPQMRNAVYGYLAEEHKQSTAAYMRGIVMPGMAALMRRPAYDFSKSYGYNRAHAAVGCYHCHLVE
jgi:PH (Pleckstrin Homology) domain-containing protein